MSSWWNLTDTKGLNQRSQPLTGSAEGVLLEAENIGFSQLGAVVQRFGGTLQSLTGSGLTGTINWSGRHITNAGVEELWLAADNAGVAALARRSSGWAAVTFSDTVVVSDLRYMHSASLNGKFFITYNSDVNRLHVWDGTSLRRVGFAPATNVTVATLGGAGITADHWYRMRYIEMVGTTLVRRSEPSPAPVHLAITNDAGWQITRGALINEGETHWEVEAADAEAGPWYRIATVVVGTTTYDDTTDPIDTSDLSAELGEYVPPPSAKYILSDGSRLLLGAAWETSASTGQTAPKQNRVWFTPVLGTTDEGDDERIPNTLDQQNWIDIGNPGPITGMSGPLYGDIYVFKLDSIWKLVTTYDAETPYRAILVTDAIGAVDQRVIIQAEQGNGIPAIFFANATGVYRLSQGGITDISEKVSRDFRLNNFSASQSLLGYDPVGKTIFVQTNSGSAVTTGQYYQFQYDLVKDEWAGISIGGGQSAWVLGRSLLGIDTYLGDAGSLERSAVVALSDDAVSRLLLSGQDSTGTAALMAWNNQCGFDGASAFTTRFRVRKFATPGHQFSVGCPTIIYRSPSGTEVTVGTVDISYIRQDGETNAGSVTLTATGQDDPLDQETKTIDGMQLADCIDLDVRVVMSYTAGFMSTIPPSIDAILIPIKQQEPYAS